MPPSIIHEQIQQIINSPAQLIFKEGIEEGMKKGIEKGMFEGKIEIALSLLKHLDEDKILEITGISRDELEQLKK